MVTLAPDRTARDREQIILDHLELADRLARRYRHNPNTTPEDLRQTARVALVSAVDRYDPTRGTPFVVFAVTTITGELKRYLRDSTWSVRIPRSVKEHALRLLRAREGFARVGGDWPSVAELTSQLELTEEQITHAMRAAESRTTLSLDMPVDEEGRTARGELLAHPEPEVEVEDVLMLSDLIAALPPVERTAVVLHYFRGLKQREIGALIGCSQMQVSRLLRRSRERMRDQLGWSSP